MVISRREVSRKTFLKLGATAVAFGAAGCDAFSTSPSGEDESNGGSKGTGGSGGSSDAKEAPQLAKLVKAGKLPALADRLPKKPLVLQPVDRLGSYGGTWHTAMVGSADTPWMQRTMNWEPVLRHNAAWTKQLPNVAESWQVKDAGATYVFKLREGLKWSDGEPFGADDIMFWYEDVFSNEKLTPEADDMFLADGKPVTVEKVDDNTVVFRFAGINGLFERHIGGGHGDAPLLAPRHFLKKFHEKYNPDGVADLAKKAGFDDWSQLFLAKSDWYSTPEMPTLHAWILKNAYGGSTTQVVAERNPYYWKVDSQGKQLPYIDKILYSQQSNNETVLLKALDGQLDMHSRHINTPTNKPVLARGREKGNFKFFSLLEDTMNVALLTLNLTIKDPVKREIYNNKDFRIGLSYALNRAEIIKTLYQSQGEPWQAAPRRETPFYNERLAKQYTKYDVKLANQHLDKAGYTERDGDGYRLGPDGKRITIAMDVTIEEGPEWPDVAQMIVQYWKKVGIYSRAKTVGRSLAETRKDSNALDMGISRGFGGHSVMEDPRFYLPYRTNENAILWAEWYLSAGKDGEEPPAPVRKQMKLYDELQATADEDRQIQLMKQILEIAADLFPVIGVALGANGYGIVKNNFHNVPGKMFDASGGYYPNPAPTNPCQYFISES